MTSAIHLNPGTVPQIEAFLQPQAWIDLNPSLSVCDAARMNDPVMFGIDDASEKSLMRLLVREGYFHIPQLPWNLPLAEMAQTIIRLTEVGLVPPFCFMYDEFWLMYARLHKMLGRLLGEGYAMLPDFWAWYVNPRKENRGWTPHRDKNHRALYPDGRPKSLTVWLPLTDATPLNGCIYMIPAYLDPTYNTPQDKEWKFAAQDVRALPANAGGLLMWNSGVVHWGGHSSPLSPGPRISIAFEFQRGDEPPMNTPLIPPLSMLTVEQRLRMICKQVLQYTHMYPLSAELKALAEGVMKRPVA
ncbi:MAG TPA: phytanoyl-CoA dioxygenase family protein [Tepidisphaeraceae bacterium]|nr:phytanoyl-CoA dioxygenase family protein [Tepidisphaeraceae bacterium]